MAVEAPVAWPALLGHLSPNLPKLNTIICHRVMHDLFIAESPIGSNRSGRIDEYNRRAGAPLGSYWCCSWSTAVWVDCGADVAPVARASCDVMVHWAMENGLWIPKESVEQVLPGDMMMYGGRTLLPAKTALPHGQLPMPGQKDATHVGLVMRFDRMKCSAEGNAAWQQHSNNGKAVVAKEIDLDLVYGFIKPRERRAA